MRVKRIVDIVHGSTFRITPARAGKTASVDWSGRKHLGSPPRVRVKLLPLPFKRAFLGITPARAGKTLIESSDHLEP